MVKRIARIIIVTTVILAIPLIAMQFTHEVNWGIMDFVIGGGLIFGLGLLLETILLKVTKPSHRTALIIVLVLIFLLIWAELAVGLF